MNITHNKRIKNRPQKTWAGLAIARLLCGRYVIFTMKNFIFLMLLISFPLAGENDSAEELIRIWGVKSEWKLIKQEVYIDIEESLSWMISENSDMEELLLHEKYETLIKKEVDDYLSYEKLKLATKKVINEVFSKGEQLDLMKFYRTDVGKKILSSDKKIESLAEEIYEADAQKFKENFFSLMEKYRIESEELSNTK